MLANKINLVSLLNWNAKGRGSVLVRAAMLLGAVASVATAQTAQTTCANPTQGATIIRNEGKTEQLFDFIFTCQNKGTVTASATITATLTAGTTITSRIVNAGSGLTEAAIVATDSLSQNSIPILGTVSGSVVTFSNVPIPVTAQPLQLEITNIRVDATPFTPPASVNQTVAVSGAGITSITFPTGPAGLVSFGLRPQGTTSVTNYPVCSAISSATPAFNVTFGESDSDPVAFKTKGSSITNASLLEWVNSNTETGYYVSSATNNLASSGTRVKVTFTNVPANINVFAPLTISTDQLDLMDIPVGSMTMISSESGAYAPATQANPPGYTGPPLGRVNISAGSGVAIYEVNLSTPNSVETYTVPVYISSFGTVTTQANPITAGVAFAPTGAASNLPFFATLGSTTFVNGSGFPPCFSISSGTLPNGVRNFAYSQNVAVSGGTPPYTWNLFSGVLPAGLALSSTTGLISGTPTTPTLYNFTISVTDSALVSVNQAYAVTIQPSVAIANVIPDVGSQGATYRLNNSATGGIGTYTWSIAGALPPGLSLNVNNGSITGTASITGAVSPASYPFTLTATDTIGAFAVASRTIVINPPLAILTTSVPTGVIGLLYTSTSLQASGGVGPYTWAITAGTLTGSGLTLTSGGVLSGTPTVTSPVNITVQVTDTHASIATQALTINLNAVLSITTTSIPDAVAGVAYSRNLVANGGSSAPVWSQLLSGVIPAGFNLSTGGTLSGQSSTAGGPFTFVARATDTLNEQAQVTLTFSIVNALAITTTTLPVGVINAAYNQTLTKAGGSGAITWSLQTGTLPSGLNLDPATGAITGTPGATGTSVFTVKATDALNAFVTQQLTIVVNSALTITSTSPLPSASLNVPYNGQFTATGGSGGYFWTQTTGNLPPGITFTSAGVISGTPTAGGTSTVSVQVSDSQNHTATGSFSLTVVSGIAISTTPLPPGVLGVVYNQTLTTSGASGPVTWAITAGTLPAGLSLTNTTTGLISGTPTATGTSVFTVSATDTSPTTVTRQLSIVINPAGLVLSSSAMPAATQGTPYNQSIPFSGGIGPYTFLLQSGTLPQAGLSLNPSTGAITGTPNTSGNLQFYVQLTDSASGVSTRSLIIPISRTTPSPVDYAVVNSGSSINRVFPSGANPSLICNGAPCNPHDITADSQGNIYAHDTGGVAKISPLGATTVVANLSPTVNGVGGIALDALGNVIFVDNKTDAIYRVKTDGTNFTQVATFPVASALELQDVYVAVEASGNYIVGSDDNGVLKIWRFTPAGAVTTLATILPASTITGLAIEPGGSIVYLDYLHSSIVRVNASTGATTVAVSDANICCDVIGLALDPVNGDFITSGTIGVICECYSLARITASGAVTSMFAGSPLSSPSSVARIPAINANTLTIQPSALPSGSAGASYGPIQFTANGGSGNYTWAATGLPAGWIMSATGLLSGNGTGSGSYNITITVTDTVTQQTGTAVRNVSIASRVSPLLLSGSTGTINTAVGGTVSANFNASGGQPPYSFTSSGLPGGVTLSSTGALSGSPSQAGNFFGSVTVRDSGTASAFASIAINVLGLNSSSLPAGTAGVSYSATISATGGVSPYSYSATGLPSGLNFSGGTFTGTVRTPGTYPISVRVSDGGGSSATGSFAVTFASPAPLTITTSSLSDGTVGALYSQSIAANGGFAPYTFALSNGSVPAGLNFSASGIVSGTPSTAGSFSFGVQATDSSGGTAIASVSITIRPAPVTITTPTPLPSGMNGTEYPAQVLAASGGTGTFTWSLTGGGLPAGMRLSPDGVVSGIPTVQGTFPVTVTATDTASARASTSLSLTVRAPSAEIQLGTGSLGFALSAPAAAVPTGQQVTVQSTDAFRQIAFAIAVSPAASWLSVTGGAQTPDTLSIGLTNAALSLVAGDYTTSVSITCTSAFCAGRGQSVAVTLHVVTAPPRLQVLSDLLTFGTTTANLSPISQAINLQNAGGGTLGVGSVTCGAPWCSVGGVPPSIPGGATASIAVSVDPASVGSGFFRTTVEIATSAGRGSIPVTLFVAANSTMTLAPSGSQFNMPAGGAPGNSNGAFLVSISSPTPVSWSAAVQPGASWLRPGTSSGTSSSTQTSSATYSIDAGEAGRLAAGAYYGRIRVTASGVLNSPLDFVVILNVSDAATPVRPDPQPAGLLFLTTTGLNPPPQTVTVYSSSSTQLGYQVSATSDGSWLTVSPATGTAVLGTPGVTTVTVNVNGLRAGVYRGGVNYSYTGASVRTVNVTLVVSSDTPGTAAGAITTQSHSVTLPGAFAPQAGCTPSALAPAQTGLVNNFSAPASWPTPLAIRLFNDCGSAVNNGQIVATFTNGDAPLILTAVDPAQGLYSGTWTPRKSIAQITINAKVTAAGYPDTTIKLAGAVTPNAAPVLTAHGTLHAFDPLVGSTVAPGTIVQIYGQNLANLTNQPSSLPLPTTLNGTSVIIGGIEAPLFYVSPTQVNAQVPFELDGNKEYQVLLQANGAITTPDTIQLSPATPGIAAFGDGTAIAQHSDASLITAKAPAKAGETVVAYLVGLGPVDQKVVSGGATPGDTLAHPLDTPVLTINGGNYPLAFVGLTPGLVGLYQMNFVVPPGLPAGTLNITIAQGTIISNQVLLPYRP